MKYQKGKIKTEHHIMKEFHHFFKEIEKIPEIKRIIPGRISRKQSGTSKQYISISYNTLSGIKLQLKKGSTAQECFITCSESNKERITILLKKLF